MAGFPFDIISFQNHWKFIGMTIAIIKCCDKFIW